LDHPLTIEMSTLNLVIWFYTQNKSKIAPKESLIQLKIYLKKKKDH